MQKHYFGVFLVFDATDKCSKKVEVMRNGSSYIVAKHSMTTCDCTQFSKKQQQHQQQQRRLWWWRVEWTVFDTIWLCKLTYTLNIRFPFIKFKWNVVALWCVCWWNHKPNRYSYHFESPSESKMRYLIDTHAALAIFFGSSEVNIGKKGDANIRNKQLSRAI